MVVHFSNRLAQAYIRALDGIPKYVVLAAWIAVAVVCLLPAGQLNDRLTQEMNSPEGSSSYKARVAFDTHFGSAVNTTALMVFTRYAVDDGIVVHPGDKIFQKPEYVAFEFALNDTVKSYDDKVLSVSGYNVVRAANLPEVVAMANIAPSNASAIMTIVYNANTADSQKFVDFVKSETKRLTAAHGLENHGLYTDVVSLQTIMASIADANDADTTLMVALIILAFVTFSYHLSSVRLLIFPGLVVTISMLTTYAVMADVASHSEVSSLMPAIVLCLLLAITLNYNIFLLGAFKQEVRSRLRLTPSLTCDEVAEVVRIVFAKAGYHVTVSALTLMVACGGIAAFPLNLVRSIGLGCMIGVLMTWLLCTTLVPALLLTFPRFFSFAMRPCCEAGPRQSRRSLRMSFGFVDDSDPLPLLRGSPRVSTESLYYRIANVLTMFPVNIIVVLAVVGVCIYPAIRAFHVEYSNQTDLYVPRKSHTADTLKDLNRQFGAGQLYQYKLLFVTNGSFVSFDATEYTRTQTILQDLADTVPNTPCKFINSASYDGTEGCQKPGFFDVAFSVVACKKSYVNCTDLQRYRTIMAVGFMREKAMWSLIQLPIDPNGEDGRKWYNEVLSKIEGYKTQYPSLQLYLSGPAAESFDSVDYVAEHFPQAVAVTAAIIVLLVGIFFLSLVMPLRCIFTVALSLFTVYGLAEMVYMEGVLQFLHFGGLEKSNTISYMAPFGALLVCVGLSLDYDIFLSTRILEYTLANRDTQEAIIFGLADAGPTTFVSCLMIGFCFGSLLFSSIPVMNQIAFYVVGTSLVDAFVMRLLLVPALLSLLGDVHWFPMLWLVEKGRLSPQDPIDGDSESVFKI
eukprot:PhM_4_TR11645/c1_g1_i4/m.68004/K06994/K06994; putative drug exporter of the RND superfamily